MCFVIEANCILATRGPLPNESAVDYRDVLVFPRRYFVQKHHAVPSHTQLVNITEKYMSLMADNGDVREDLRIPDGDLGKEIEAKFKEGDELLVSWQWLALATLLMVKGVLFVWVCVFVTPSQPHVTTCESCHSGTIYCRFN